MSDERIKIYKNKERGKNETRQAYTPQYQIMGVEPDEIKSGIVPGTSVSNPVVIQHAQTNDNPRTRRVGIRQPYANPTPSGPRGPVPNVGNNMEHTWSSVNGEIIDDLTDFQDQELDPNRQMVDNNDYVTDEALGFTPRVTREELPTLDELVSPPGKQFVHEDNNDDATSIINKLSEGDYLLMVGGVSVCSGDASAVQEQARLLVFGDHELCDGNPVPVDDIVVIKRIPIKIGLFLE